MTHYPATNDVLYLKANINYTDIFLSDGSVFISSYTLKKVIKKHYQSFHRVNRSVALNPVFVTEQSGNQISLPNKTFTISRRRL